MTIAIGYHCRKGVIVGADTAIILGADLQEGSKLDKLWGPSGSFAFVNASEDGHATATLISDIANELRTANVRSIHDLSALLKRHMTEWRRAFGARKPPGTQLILGACLQGHVPKLFFCEPPNTVREIDDYAAIGSGASVTDAIYNRLFEIEGGDHTDLEVILRRIAYMIYRAKKDHVYAGKNTDCAVVSRSDCEPVSVRRLDMHLAELNGDMLDEIMSLAANFALSSSEQTIDHNASEVAHMLKTFESLRTSKFHDDRAEEEIKI